MKEPNAITTVELLTVRDAARCLAVAEKTLRNLSHPNGPIPVIRIGRAVRWDVADLRAFIESQKTPPDSNL